MVSVPALLDASLHAAGRLRALGVGPGDRVGILLRVASVEYIVLALGTLRLGAICVPLNARNKSHELRYAAGNAGLRVLLTSGEYATLVEEAGLPEGCRLVLAP